MNGIEYIRLLLSPLPPSVIPGTVAVSEDMLSWMAASVMEGGGGGEAQFPGKWNRAGKTIGGERGMMMYEVQ